MKINFDNLLRENESKDFDFEISLADTEIDKCHPFVSPVKAQIRLTPLYDALAIRLDGVIKYNLELPCSRCLTLVSKKETLNISHILKKDENAEDDYSIYIDRNQIDLDNIVYSDVILNIPTKVLCKDDCKGLCPKCGKNLNEGQCECN
jgi:uncharacterized protein